MRSPATPHGSRPRDDDDDEEEEEEEDALIDQQGCGHLYRELEECMGENDRDWSKCQSQVQALRRCYEAWSARQQRAGAVRATSGEAQRQRPPSR
ncbi:hypothetical protein CDCA_CDCA05G1660 [Cyanidium caldarium]|uniref:CHCH domain-containing protein n=1 Tax=Cyanidium caldarium TaxID=2771 RepID=A0AAV9IU44_CYACA|nr:hypothetical protein CDCA_CDCA05G1660 [Cyanidium caldarium]